MAVIYVDCDDTLVLWQNSFDPEEDKKHPFGDGADSYEVNYDLIAKIERMEEEGHLVIIWSGGGKGYASMWGRKFFGQSMHGNPVVFASFAKSIPEMRVALDTFLDRGLIIIDDDKGVLDWFKENTPEGLEDKVKTYTPEEYVEE